MFGIIRKTVGPCGVVVLARGPVSRKWYVAYNGRVLTKTDDAARAGSLYSDFATHAETDRWAVGIFNSGV